MPPPPIIDTRVISRIIALGIHEREAADIFASNEETYLKASLDLVEVRAADQKLTPLGSPAAFFRTALRGRFVDEQKQRVLTTPVVTIERPAITEPPTDPVVANARKAALKIYDGLPDVEREVHLDQFLSRNPAFVVFVRKSPTSRVVREALAQWLVEQSVQTD